MGHRYILPGVSADWAFATEVIRQNGGRFSLECRRRNSLGCCAYESGIGLGLRYLTRLQVTLVGWADGRNEHGLGMSLKDLAAPHHVILGCVPCP